MRGIIATSTMDAGRLLQFGVLEVNKVHLSVESISKGFVGALLEVEVDNIKRHLLSVEDCYTISVPLSVNGEIVEYGPVYATSKSVLLRSSVSV